MMMHAQSSEHSPDLRTLSMMIRFKSHKLPQIFAAFAGIYLVFEKYTFLLKSILRLCILLVVLV